MLRQYIAVQKFQRISNKIWKSVLRRFSMCSSFSLPEQLTPNPYIAILPFTIPRSQVVYCPSHWSVEVVVPRTWWVFHLIPPIIVIATTTTTVIAITSIIITINTTNVQHRHQLIINIIIMSLKCWGCTKPNLPGLTSNATKVFKTCKFSQGPITVQIFNKNLQKCQRRNLFNVEIVQLMQYWQHKTDV